MIVEGISPLIGLRRLDVRDPGPWRSPHLRVLPTFDFTAVRAITITISILLQVVSACLRRSCRHDVTSVNDGANSPREARAERMDTGKGLLERLVSPMKGPSHCYINATLITCCHEHPQENGHPLSSTCSHASAIADYFADHVSAHVEHDCGSSVHEETGIIHSI